VDPTGKSIESFVLSVVIIVSSFAHFGPVSAAMATYVILTADSVANDDKLLCEFLRSFQQGIDSLAANNKKTMHFDTVYLLTSKKVCRAMAKFIDPHLKMTRAEIEQEIYFHALVAFASGSVQNILPSDWAGRAEVVDLDTNGDTTVRKVAYFLAWLIPDSW